jgi:dUTP pyrophosphatase
MFPVTIKFIKTHDLAVLPKFNHSDPYTGDSGIDLTAVEQTIVPAKGYAVVPVGLKLGHITPGYWIRVEGRSGVGFKKHIFPHFGIIDNPYRGDMGIKLYNFGTEDQTFNAGDKIAQLIIYPLIQADIEWTDQATETSRGEKGFGSSDNPNIKANGDGTYGFKDPISTYNHKMVANNDGSFSIKV